jgi:PAS domain S-box-containing protein
MTDIQTATKTNAARRLWRWLVPPTSYDEEQQRIRLAVRFFGVSAAAAVLPFVFIEWFYGWVVQARSLVLVEFVILGALWLNRHGHSNAAALLLNGTGLAAGAVLVFVSAAGFRDVTMLLFPAIPVVAALLLPRRYYWPMSASVVLVAAILIFLQIHGLLPKAPRDGGYHELLGAAVILINISVLAGYLVATLAASNRFSQATIDALPQEVCVLDGSGRVLAVNRAWRRFADANPPVPPGAFVGANYLEVCERATGPEAADAATFAAGLRAVLRGQREDFEMAYACPSQEAEYCFSAHVTRFPGTGEARVVITHEDITARKLAEEETQRTQARLRRLLDNLQDGYLHAGPDGRYVLVSPSAARIFGYDSVEELIGVRAEALYASPGERASVLEKLRTEGRLADRVLLARRKDGTTFWVSMSAQHCHGDGGEIVGTEALIRDITDRKLAEERLRFSEEQHRKLVHQLPAGVVVHAPDTRILLANTQACSLLGVPEDQIRGMGAREWVWTFLGEDGIPLRLEEYPVNRVLSSRAPVRDMVAAVKRGDEDMVWLLINAFPEFTPEEELRQVVVIFADITKSRRVEEERRQLEEELTRSDRLASMGLLAAGLAHEINNPLAYTLYNLESLCEDLPRYVRQLALFRQALANRLGETQLREMAGRQLEGLEPRLWLDVEARFSDALQGTRRIKDIARRLSTFSRVDGDQIAPVALAYAIESAIQIASNEIKYRATIVRDISPTAPVMASEGRLSQVFLNLLINAAQAIEEGSPDRNTIRVRTWQEGATVVAEVSDTGCGIPAVELQRIFDPFFSTKAAGSGSGLGLSIVQGILAAYGGTIDAESEVGKGTRFLIRLPAADQQSADNQAGVAGDAGVPTRGRVLVIDDDAGIRKAVRRILGGHELIEADSGRRARELLSTDHTFDVILCDIGMPNISGIEVHLWLVEHAPPLAERVVFLTGGAFLPAAREYLQKVPNPRVEKPFDAANLEKLVAGFISRRNSV